MSVARVGRSISLADPVGIGSETVTEFFQENTDAKFVDKDVFFLCWSKIKPLIDLSILVGYLMKHGLVKSSEDMECLTSSFFKPQDKFNSLVKMVEASGKNGFMLLYICLKESMDGAKGHEFAVQELDHSAAEQRNLDPPWRRQSSSNVTSSSVPVINKNPNNPIVERISSLETQFSYLSSTFLDELTENQVTVKEVRKHVISLPYRLKRELFQTISQHAPTITKKSDMVQLFLYLDATIWNFVDYSLLEHLVLIFGGADIKKEMETYVSDMTAFARETTVSQLIQYWPGRKEAPPAYFELKATVDLNPDECTLERLNSLRKGLSKQFLPLLSEYALLHWKFSQGSVVVTWLIPNNFVPSFTNNVCMSESTGILDTLKVTNLRIQGILVYPISANEAVDSITDQSDYHSLLHQTLEFQVILTSLGDCEQTRGICDKMTSLTRKVTNLLRARGISARNVIEIFPKLPTKKQFNYLSYMQNKLMKGSYTVSSHNLFGPLHFGLLKVSIDKFRSKALRDELEAIIQDVISLRNKITATDFIERGSGKVAPLPEDYKDIQLAVSKEPNMVNLQYIEDIREEFVNEFVPKSLRGSVFLYNIVRGSSVVTWAMPSKAAEEANALIRQDNDRSFFEKHDVLTLSVQEKVAYSRAAPLAVMNISHSSTVQSMTDRQCPRVALNNKGWLVQTYKDQHLQTAFYRIGEVRREFSEIRWHCKEWQYQSGKNSQICMNDEGTIVEVFQNSNNMCCYRIGRLNTDDKVMKWVSEPAVFASGQHPCVAINNKGMVVTAFERGCFQKDLFYRVGELDWFGHTISWREEERSLVRKCSRASVTINDRNTVVFSFTSSTCCSFITGRVNPQSHLDTKQQSGASSVSVPPEPKPESNSSGGALTLNHDSAEGEPRQRFPGRYHTVTAANRHGHLVSARIVGHRVTFYTGRLDPSQHRVTERELRRSERRLNNTSYRILSSSVSLNDSNLVVFSCHIAYGPLNWNKIVFTSLGVLTPDVV